MTRRSLSHQRLHITLRRAVTEKHLMTCKWVCGLCVAAYLHVPIPPGTGFSLFPFPVSPLTPTVNTNCERGTKTARQPAPLLIFNNVLPPKRKTKQKKLTGSPKSHCKLPPRPSPYSPRTLQISPSLSCGSRT